MLKLNKLGGIQLESPSRAGHFGYTKQYLAEVAAVIRGFKSAEYQHNAFINKESSKLEIPAIWQRMDDALAGYLDETYGSSARRLVPLQATHRRASFLDSGMRADSVDFQFHTISVDAHTDDVQAGRFFQVYVLSETLVCEPGTQGLNSSKLVYYDERGKQCSAYLPEGSSVVINPRRSHSLTYFGLSPLLALRTLVLEREKGSK